MDVRVLRLDLVDVQTELETLAVLTRGVQFTAEGRNVRLDARYDAGEAVDTMRRAARDRQPARERTSNPPGEIESR